MLQLVIGVASEQGPTMKSEKSLLNFQLFQSQGRRGNSNTRETPSENVFLKRMYVETNLDRILMNDIINAKYDLVVITGNPGDGKTAFLKRLEEKGTPIADRPNGRIFAIGKTTIELNYDGSQDSGNIDNNKILSDIFDPVEEALNNEERARHVRVIAINEGRLIKQLNSRDDKGKQLYPILNRIANNQLEFQSQDHFKDTTVIVVDLNKRSIVARRSEKSSIFEDILNRMADKKWWASCKKCKILEHCPVQINVSNIRRGIIIERMRELVRMLALWGNVHVTIRDILSALSHILFGQLSCDEIRENLNNKNLGWEKWVVERLYFNTIFSGNEKDRVLSKMGLFEIFRFPAPPKLDSDSFFGKPSDIIKRYTKNPSDAELLRIVRLIDVLSKSAKEKDPLFGEWHHYTSMKNLFYFEGRDEDILNLVPVPYYYRFKDDLGIDQGNTEFEDFVIRRQFIDALNKSRGIEDKKDLFVEHSEAEKGRIMSFSQFYLKNFQVIRDDIDLPFCETEPEQFFFIYNHNHNTRIKLSIGLEMYNMIRAIGEGYFPTKSEMEGNFFNLDIFMEQLEELGSLHIKIFDTLTNQEAEVSTTKGRVDVS